MIDTKLIVAGTGCTPSASVAWQGPLSDACSRFHINTSQRIAAFLSQIGVESAQLTALVENLNYSAQGLANTWPNRYSNTGKAGGAPNALALGLARKPQQIANNVYANRFGNGSEASGDGFKYRGRSLIQITFHDNYAVCGKAIGLDLVAQPELLELPENAAVAAAWFFDLHGCNSLADSGRFAAITRAINGQPPCAGNNGPLRQSRFEAAQKVSVA